ncbi:peptidase, partial [Bacillus pseudomycoides]
MSTVAIVYGIILSTIIALFVFGVSRYI